MAKITLFVNVFAKRTTSITAMDCTVSPTADKTSFTLATAFNDDIASLHSSPFVLSISSTPIPADLKAVIATNGTLTGPAPLSVAFNGSSPTGTIALYQ